MNTNFLKKLPTLALTFAPLAATRAPASAQRRGGNTSGQRQAPACPAPEATAADYFIEVRAGATMATGFVSLRR